jgi:hypothetical protein
MEQESHAIVQRSGKPRPRHCLRLLGVLVGLFLTLVLSGCARWPIISDGDTSPLRSLTVSLTVAGTINPNYYYFVAIDTDGNTSTGPVPDATGLANGWGILAPTSPGQPVQAPAYYVEYHNGTFIEVVNGQPLGQPYQYSVNGNTMTMTLDLAHLGTPIPPSVQFNLITQENLTTASPGQILVKSYDGIGFDGNDYLADLRLDVAQTLTANQPGTPQELRYGSTYSDGTSVEATTANAGIDLTGWQIQVSMRPG